MLNQPTAFPFGRLVDFFLFCCLSFLAILLVNIESSFATAFKSLVNLTPAPLSGENLNRAIGASKRFGDFIRKRNRRRRKSKIMSRLFRVAPRLRASPRSSSFSRPNYACQTSILSAGASRFRSGMVCSPLRFVVCVFWMSYHWI